ncbi:serine/threonine protein kinase [Polyangium aurulentum]|nr:serine/threonine protein kinase [Polyangium aurulentum]
MPPARPGTAPAPAPSPRSAEPITSRKPAQRSLVGTVIGGKYGVKALIGEGGMGAVYEAEHLAIGRKVAVKVMHPKHAQQSESVARLRHEARVAGSIGHPNICEIHDLGRLDDGTPYLVMERLVGETLDERIKREGALPERDIADVMSQVLSALAAAHAKGIIHRDLKPENIFLVRRAGSAPLAKLLDFGISKAIDADEHAADLTMPGIVMGTPYYMAPEQARGDRGLDHRVDLWAAGVILYESLSGRRPFVARNYNALLVQILTSKHRPLSEVRPGITPALERVVDKALSKMREDRFQAAGEFHDAIRRALEPDPVAVQRKKVPSRVAFSEEPEEDETMILSLSHQELGLLGGGRNRAPRSTREGSAAVCPPANAAVPPSSPPSTLSRTQVTQQPAPASAPAASAPASAPASSRAPLPPPSTRAPLPPPPPSTRAPLLPPPPPPPMAAPPPRPPPWAAQAPAYHPAPPHPAPAPPLAVPRPGPPPPPPPPRPAPAAAPMSDDDAEDEHTLVDPPSFADDRTTLVRPFPAPTPEKGT